MRIVALLINSGPISKSSYTSERVFIWTSTIKRNSNIVQYLKPINPRHGIKPQPEIPTHLT